MQLLDNSELLRRLKRTKPFEVASWALQQSSETEQWNTPTQQPTVTGKPTHDTSAVSTANKGPMKIMRTN
jgi:hypothetical protein